MCSISSKVWINPKRQTPNTKHQTTNNKQQTTNNPKLSIPTYVIPHKILDLQNAFTNSYDDYHRGVMFVSDIQNNKIQLS
jgi:hypothetical protein